jgi:hypothetical protein
MPATPSIALLFLLSGTIASALPAAMSVQSIQPAQTDEPQSEPENQHQRIEIIKDTLPRVGTNETPIEPTEAGTSEPHETGLTEGQDWMQIVNNSIGAITKPSSLAEGSFILSRNGRLVPAPNDRLIFVPDPEQRLPGEGPVLLLPCAALERLENIWANQPVTVSGEILTYHGRNHLLISDFTLGLSDIIQAPVEATTEQSTKPVEPEAELDEDPDVLDILRELDAENGTPSGTTFNDPIDDRFADTQRPRPQSSQLQTAPPELAPGIREGDLMIRRPARIDRAQDGSWMVIFDNDNKTAAHGIELTLQPCSLLMTMENQALAFGDSARFVVSGRIYVHNARGYLLPTFYQRLRTSDIKPWQ